MQFRELKFILDSSRHTYMVDGALELQSIDYVTKHAIIILEEHIGVLPFDLGNTELVVAIDEEFVFNCSRIELTNATTIELTITNTLAA